MNSDVASESYTINFWMIQLRGGKGGNFCPAIAHFYERELFSSCLMNTYPSEFQRIISD